MSYTEKVIIRWISAIAAGLSAILMFLIGYPGDLVPQIWLLVIGGASAFLSTVIAVATGAKPEPPLPQGGFVE